MHTHTHTHKREREKERRRDRDRERAGMGQASNKGSFSCRHFAFTDSVQHQEWDSPLQWAATRNRKADAWSVISAWTQREALLTMRPQGVTWS